MARPHPPIIRYHRFCRLGLRVDIRLGSPERHNCAGLGICSIWLRDRTADNGHCSEAMSAYLRLESTTGRLLLHLVNSGLPPVIRQRHLPGGYLTVTGPYRLPRVIAWALGLDGGGHHILPGRYPVLDDGTFCTASFPLRKVTSIRRRSRPAA